MTHAETTGTHTIATAPGTEPGRPEPARRPRDRKATIAERAGELFAERGFASVRMDEIAASVGITARAVYRHYENKQTLLSHIVNTSQQRYLAAFDQADDLDTLLPLLASASLDSMHFAVLWQREARHLAPDDLAGLRRRLNGMAGKIAAAIAAHRPELGTAHTEIRAWVALAILSSPGHHDLSLPRPAFDRLLIAACRAAIDSPPAHGDQPEVTGNPVAPNSRREQLLTAAARAFRRSGFQTVGIDEIGDAAGVAGPAIYRYFDAKTDILVTLLTRYLERLAHETSRALRHGDQADPEGLLAALVGGHITVAIEDTDLVAVAITEAVELTAPDADRFSRLRAEELAEWSHWLGRARPDLHRTQAAILARIAAILVDDTVRVAHLHLLPALRPELQQQAMAVLQNTDLDATDDT